MSDFLFSVVGLGGYAGNMVDLLLRCQREGLAPVRLAAVCDPDEAKLSARREELERLGVKLHGRFEDLLCERADLVWLPLPIGLHLAYTERALAAGKPVLCEKPAAGCLQDVDAMIAARDRAKLPVIIGFHDLYAPGTWRMKDELLSGAIGQIRTATVYATWPRDSAYFGRNGWAGALQRNGVWVLDSPANNALAHYIHMPLFWLGQTRTAAAELVQVEAELYRANAIENYDTCTLRLTTSTGAQLLVYLTHACADTNHPIIELHGERGTARYEFGGRMQIRRGSDVVEWSQGDCRVHMVQHAIRHVRGEKEEEVGTLELARAHALAISATSDAAKVIAIPEGNIRTTTLSNATRREMPGIESVLRTCCGKRQLLHETAQVSWSRPAGKLDLRTYSRFSSAML